LFEFLVKPVEMVLLTALWNGAGIDHVQMFNEAPWPFVSIGIPAFVSSRFRTSINEVVVIACVVADCFCPRPTRHLTIRDSYVP
jgi:hypothetical protein